MGAKRNTYSVLVKKPGGRPTHRWGEDLRETGWSHMDWIHLAQDRDQWRALVNMVMNLWVS
jgi:hypothetical protein